MFVPGYLKLYNEKKLDERIDKLYDLLENCRLCPRKCGIDRTKGKKGFCRSGMEVIITSIGPHFGEEPELVSTVGSGTIFLTNCSLGCVYCQNFHISHLQEGKRISLEQVAKSMLYLKDIGCHNINFVTPTHFIPQIIKSVRIAAGEGLNLPLVYNCGGYENVETIKLLDGIIDIYMPDIKYSDDKNSEKYSNAIDYFDRCKESIIEMHRQAGDLKIDNGIAKKGLLVRHLVLPKNIAGSEKAFEFLSSLSKNTYINIMDQYKPMHRVSREFQELNRRTSIDEYNKTVELAKKYGLSRGFANTKPMFFI